MSWCDLDLTFDLAVVTMIYKIFSGLYLGNCVGSRKLVVGSSRCRCRKLIHGRNIGWECKCKQVSKTE